ncbi:MAG: hypothetical protein A2951_01920 [Candidatus Buchananbacteria bacterium RIFCSPLOWO2_01_FULL_56_15]|uniref:Uncharacterized protein n=2 Tax=Candidatus Buchananiibacteriota TaxID=1817903 RepID=A0A1G1YE36_9BACT|nr:MAG: hypothetical protein A3J59_01325 [Candidatus Buchananbacteria bacterium RIFCSPHIGHO2_02_FULL_56_16]OGY55363.1 MAG: hypothetical protein A2951_01920 [Candidatus Buchananbacteria bacterium RIFCSPLOWO2_01_FULL_56_15]
MAYQMNQPKITTPLAMPPAAGQSALASPRKSRGPWIKGLVTLVIVVILIAGGVYLLNGSGGLGLSGIQLRTQWQAVFLTNGQVYFGKISKINNDYIWLHDIYYLQVVTQPLQRSQEGDTAAPQQQEQRLTLIKLGNELHGPRDEMIINRDQMVLLEDLKDDSRVVQAINDYVNGQQQPAP